MTKATDAVAQLFGAMNAKPANFPAEIYPGYPGLVVADGELQSMVWGFPLVLKGKSGQPLKPKPVNNARTDKLDSGFWNTSFRDRRCLIPMEAFAEAEGPKGSKTRTWLSLPDADVFACAGIWRESAEWGRCYSMVMTEAAESAKDVHDRMPVILEPGDYEQWLHGSPDDAKTLCQPYVGEIAIERTDVPWVRR